MSKSKKTTKPLKQSLQEVLSIVRKYLWLLILVFFVLIYGYILLKINDFQNQQPSQSAISTNLQTTPQAVINPKIVNQLDQLKTNSVSVRALFNNSRQNPF